MKIMFEIEDRIRQDSTCVYFKRAFEKLADVKVVYPEELKYIRPGIFDLHIRVDYGINNPFPKDLKPSAYYAIDTHIDPEWRVDMAKNAEFDHVFCAQYPGTQLEWGTRNVYWLPLACDPEIHKPDRYYDKVYDVCFIGNTQPGWQSRRIERLDKLFKAVPNFWTGNRFFQEATKVYAQSRIVFNSAHSNDINMRVFEAMCSGSLLLTDKQNWNGLWEPDIYFGEYTDKDMADRALYYLKYDYRREEMAKRAQAFVVEKHKYIDRAKEMLKKCGF